MDGWMKRDRGSGGRRDHRLSLSLSSSLSSSLLDRESKPVIPLGNKDTESAQPGRRRRPTHRWTSNGMWVQTDPWADWRQWRTLDPGPNREEGKRRRGRGREREEKEKSRITQTQTQTPQEVGLQAKKEIR